MQTGALTRAVPSQEITRSESCLAKSLSPSTQMLFKVAEKLAQTAAPILIVGESGTGKRALAVEIHRISGFGEEEFKFLDCAEPDCDVATALDDLIDDGTVFFRDIAGLSTAHQLRTFEVFFDGNNKGNHSGKVRVIASSRHPLEEQVTSGRFREDLYYRISPFCLCVPPLRQRKEDIPLLAEHFVSKYSALLGHRFEMSPQLVQLLSGYTWPGNVRELEQVVRTIVAIGDESIALAMIRSSGLKAMTRDSKVESLSLKRAAREASRKAERELILNTLFRTHWNRKRAARELQISYKALLYKLKQIGIDDDNTLGVEA
jgi:two-component system, NtrC family, response regulator AtoC